MLRLLTLSVLASSPLQAAPFPRPEGLAVLGDAGAPLLRWQAVKGAGLYRVAVWAEPDAEGRRPLMVAAWVKGTSYSYGSKDVVSKAGKLPSTPAAGLKPGNYKAWVAAAGPEGEDKSEWASADLKWMGAPAPVPSFTPTPDIAFVSTPTPPGASGGDAEVEVDLAADFKETPEPSEEPSPQPTPMGTPSMERAQAALESGKAEDAVEIYLKLVEADATDAAAWEGLGDSYDARKMKAEAKEAYEKALALDRKRVKARQWIEENVRR